MRSTLAFCLFFLALLVQAVALQRCATPTAPQGGPRDTLGPVLLEEGTTPNFQTNFRPDRIELTFNEWVELDPQQPIVISPPIEFGPEQQPELRRRTLAIPLEGVELLDNVTYVVSIGGAIKDLNEGNVSEDLRFVFATGPVLDTAEVTGVLVDAFSGDPLEGALMTLYGDLTDTAYTTANPTYFAPVDKQGRFTVSNVKPGSYRAVAIVRNAAARNYFLDFDGYYAPTAVGFLDTLLTVGPVTTDVGTVRLSPILPAPRIAERDTSIYGLLRLRLNQPAENVDVVLPGGYLRENSGDTLRLYYRERGRDTIFVGIDTARTDTFAFASPERLPPATAPPANDSELGRAAGPLRLRRRTGGKLNPGQGLVLTFNRPVVSLDTATVLLSADSLATPLPFTYAVDTLDPTQVAIRHPWQEDSVYTLTLPPGTVTDWFGLTNPDTIATTFNFIPRSTLGDLTVQFEDLDPLTQYIVYLGQGQENEPVIGTKRVITDRSEYTLQYRALAPGTYQVELLEDVNRNGRYDGGDWRFFRQPEVVRRFEIEPLRANWEVEQTVRVEE